MADYYLVDNEGNIRTTKHLVGHIQTVFNEIRSNEKIVYPWKVSKMIELYFSKAIYYINDKTLNHYFEDRPIGELDVIFLKHIYDAKDKHYNGGSVILEK